MSPNSFEQILLRQAARYPAWQAQDVYKLAHQAALGSEHAVSDPARAQSALQLELARLKQEAVAAKAEPLIEPIRADGSLVRVHLRPLMDLKLSPALLLAAFIESAKQIEGGCDTLGEYLDIAVRLADHNLLGVAPAALHRLQESLRARGYPASHHSDIYTHYYRPAYRVVARTALPAEWYHLRIDKP